VSCSVLCCSAAMCCSVLQRLVLQCAAVCCSVLQCVAVCSSVLQCVAVCCSVLQCVAVPLSAGMNQGVQHQMLCRMSKKGQEESETRE